MGWLGGEVKEASFRCVVFSGNGLKGGREGVRGAFYECAGATPQTSTAGPQLAS